MGKKLRIVPVYLDAKGISRLPFEEIKSILRGTDDLMMRGGRSLLAKVLKGSKEKKVLELKLNRSTVYGYYKELSKDEITAKIDWLILNGYLRIEYDYRLPLLVYTRKGWEIEMDTYTDELLEGFNKMIEGAQSEFNMNYLKDRNREMILLLLDKVEATEDSRYISILNAWKKVDYKKVQKRINEVIKELEKHMNFD